MIRLQPFGLGLAMAVFLAIPALAETACSVRAYSAGNLHFDIAVHEGPAPSSPTLGVLRRGEKGTDDEGLGAEFTVVEAREGWVRIAQVTGIDGVGVGGPEGWIDGAYVRFVAQTELGFAEPDPASRVVYANVDWPYAQGVLDCKGDWALIRYDVLDRQGDSLVSAGQSMAWVRGACSNQRTTCDGVSGDGI